MTNQLRKVVIINDTSYALHHGSKEVMLQLNMLLLQSGFTVIASCPVGVDWRNHLSFKHSLDAADIIIVNGEGTLHHAQKTAHPLAAVAAYAKQKNIPSVLLNTTYQDNGEEIAALTRSFDLIFVRDKQSQVDLANFDIPADVVPDLTFYSSFQANSTIKKYPLAYTDSVVPELSTLLHGKLGASTVAQARYLPIIASPTFDARRKFKSLLRLSIKQIKLGFLLLKKPWLNNLSPSELDLLFSVPNTTCYKNMLASTSFLVTARYHSLCFALQLAVPFIAIAPRDCYRFKGLMEEVELDPQRFIHDYKQLEHFRDITPIPFNDLEKENITNFCKNAQQKINAMFEKIKNLQESYATNKR